jgi:hypothetical protein
MNSFYSNKCALYSTQTGGELTTQEAINTCNEIASAANSSEAGCNSQMDTWLNCIDKATSTACEDCNDELALIEACLISIL